MTSRQIVKLASCPSVSSFAKGKYHGLGGLCCETGGLAGTRDSCVSRSRLNDDAGGSDARRRSDDDQRERDSSSPLLYHLAESDCRFHVGPTGRPDVN